ncbi:MAG TPA: hypothetical protein VGJ03_00045 [Acidimicrobiales bacterium]
MDPDEFNERLRDLSGQAITALAIALRHDLDSVDGEVSWWRATITIGATLRRCHRSREAGLAAHSASVALLEAVGRSAVPVSREDATVVARAASEAARVLVAERDPALPNTAAEVVLAQWHALVAA